MIYELRVYEAMPGRMPDLLARFNDHTLPIWAKHGIRQVGFWTTLIGESNNRLTYFLAWESLADREARWTAFLGDPAWHKARDESEKNGLLVERISNELLTPTAFSALR
jgi:NIPSNAP protein